MTSNLVNHDNLATFIRTDISVWHRAFSFQENTVDGAILARSIKEATGIALMAETNQDPARGEVIPETLHGFISMAHIPHGGSGTCDWCLSETAEATPHACVIITLYEEHVSEGEALENVLETLLQNHNTGEI